MLFLSLPRIRNIEFELPVNNLKKDLMVMVILERRIVKNSLHICDG